MIKELEKNMLYLDNLDQYTKLIINNFTHINKKKIIVNQLPDNLTENIKNIFYVPEHDDKLFWCFFILFNGFDKYEFVKNNSFKIEKDFKIKTIEELRQKKDLLKEYKIKRNLIENELLNEKKISIKSLNLLALIYKLNIIFVSGRIYLLMNYSNTEKIEDSVNIIIQKDKGYQIYSNFSDESEMIKKDLDNIIKNYWQIEDINKYIKAISAYTLSDLTEISKKLDIHLISQSNKKKGKKELYEEILLKLNLL